MIDSHQQVKLNIIWLLLEYNEIKIWNFKTSSRGILNFLEISIINLITYKRCKYLINKASKESHRSHHSMRLDAHIGTAYICFKIRTISPCLAIIAKVRNRSVEMLLLGLLCIWFIKENDLSGFQNANRKNAQYLQKFSTDWAKCSVKYAENVSSACWFKMDAANIDHSWRIQRRSHPMNSSWKYAGTLREKCLYSELFWSASSRIPHTEYLFVFSPNAGKCGSE